MKKPNQLYRVIAKLWLCSFIIFLSMFGSGCQPANPMVTGIRVEARSTRFDLVFGPIDAPVPNTPNRGTWAVDAIIPHPTNTGDKDFNGRTDARGISDYPSVRVDAFWDIVVGPTISPPCAASTFSSHRVNAPGAAFHYTCVL